MTARQPKPVSRRRPVDSREEYPELADLFERVLRRLASEEASQ